MPTTEDQSQPDSAGLERTVVPTPRPRLRRANIPTHDRHLYFIRLKTRYELQDYYEEKTDVWVIGDVAGYRYFAGVLRRAADAQGNFHVEYTKRPPNSMRVVVMSARREARGPRVKFVERVVFRRRRPEMELVIVGNRRGYAKLGAMFQDAMRNTRFALDGHLHADDFDDNWVMPRSVQLTICDPLSIWSDAVVRKWSTLVHKRQSSYLPTGIDHLALDFPSYEEPDPRTRVFRLR